MAKNQKSFVFQLRLVTLYYIYSQNETVRVDRADTKITVVSLRRLMCRQPYLTFAVAQRAKAIRCLFIIQVAFPAAQQLGRTTGSCKELEHITTGFQYEDAVRDVAAGSTG